MCVCVCVCVCVYIYIYYIIYIYTHTYTYTYTKTFIRFLSLCAAGKFSVKILVQFGAFQLARRPLMYRIFL